MLVAFKNVIKSVHLLTDVVFGSFVENLTKNNDYFDVMVQHLNGTDHRKQIVISIVSNHLFKGLPEVSEPSEQVQSGPTELVLAVLSRPVRHVITVDYSLVKCKQRHNDLSHQMSGLTAVNLGLLVETTVQTLCRAVNAIIVCFVCPALSKTHYCDSFCFQQLKHILYMSTFLHFWSHLQKS